jgi:hypothetical protein
MKDTKELSPVQVLREATIADLASEIGTARSVSGSASGRDVAGMRSAPQRPAADLVKADKRCSAVDNQPAN